MYHISVAISQFLMNIASRDKVTFVYLWELVKESSEVAYRSLEKEPQSLEFVRKAEGRG